MKTAKKQGKAVLSIWLLIALCAMYVLYVAGKKGLTVHGGYSEWSEFTACSVSCGGGVMTRRRTCTNPPPNYFGRNCSILGLSVQTLKCQTQHCPINGGFGEWGDYGACSVTCGDGTKTRERLCNNPSPQYGGKECIGEGKMSESCNQGPCPVDGGYGEWSDWSACSATCNSGKKTRTRKCEKPSPKNGGKNCEEQGLGDASETEICEEAPCSKNKTEPNAATNKSTTGDVNNDN